MSVVSAAKSDIEHLASDSTGSNDDDAGSEAEPVLLDHAYDGIQEYDNPLPGWWRMFFVGTIVFAGFYGLYFHVVKWGRTPDESYRAALAGYEEKREARERAELAQSTEDELAQRARSPQAVAHGQKVFLEKCVQCHKPDGSGLIGPNLTDEFQLHGMTRLDIFKTVRGGVPGTAMIPWIDQLSATDVMAVALYAASLRGQNLPGKQPEGKRVGPMTP